LEEMVLPGDMTRSILVFLIACVYQYWISWGCLC